MIFSCPEWAIILQYCDYATVRLCQYNIFLVIKVKLVCLWIVNVKIIFECISCLNIIWVLFIFSAWHDRQFCNI